MVSAEDFYNRYNGKAIDDDGYPKSNPVQCVDAFRIFCRYIGISPYPTPNNWADGYWYGRSSHTAFFDAVTSGFRDGDWVIWPRGSASHKYSHIAMMFRGMSFGENQGGNHQFCLKQTDFSDALGALRPKVFEGGVKVSDLVEGYQCINWCGVTCHIYKQKDELIGMMSAKGDPDYKAIQDIKLIDNDYVHRCKINCNYFEMSNQAEYGQHYGVEQSFTMDLAPKQAGWQVLFMDKKGNLFHTTADQYWFKKTDVSFACSPFGILLWDGKSCEYLSSACGNKMGIVNTQTALWQMDDGKFAFVVTGKMLPSQVRDMALAYGAKICVLFDSGGSTQMVLNGAPIQYTSRKIPNVLTLYYLKDPASPSTPTADDKDKQIADLTAKVTDLTAKVGALQNTVSKAQIAAQATVDALK